MIEKPSLTTLVLRLGENFSIRSTTPFPYETVETCTLPGCGRVFHFIIFPDVTIYPRFCEDHRSEFRRKLFLEMQARGLRPRPPEAGTTWPDWEEEKMGARVARWARKRPRQGPLKTP